MKDADNDKLNKTKSDLETINRSLIEIATNIMNAGNSAAHNFDFYVLSIINRAIALNKGYLLLLENENSLTAISIVRLQLDNALRLFATTIVEDGNNFLEHFFDGKPINEYRVGKSRLTDKFLATELDKERPGALDLYNYLCGYVHFSNKHFDATKDQPKSENALFRMVVGDFDVLNNEQKILFNENMFSISTTIIRLSRDWVIAKKIALE
jgi:hypothetical protein